MTTMPYENRNVVLIAAAMICVLYIVPDTARSESLPAADVAALAARCAPGVAIDVIETVARTESGNDPWVLHDNTAGDTIRPDSFIGAQSDAETLMAAGHSVDIGLMQINSANLTALGITASQALDACTSMAGGAAILQAAYGGGDTNAEQQVALLVALSRYNTGTPFKGIMNGYARAVMRNGASESAERVAIPPPTSPADPNAPASWNVWASADYAQQRGAAWLINAPHETTRSAPVKAAPSPLLAFATTAPDDQNMPSIQPRSSP
jgi:type IV secretion system protein VirB1